MPSFRIEPSAYLANVNNEFREDLEVSGVLNLIEEVLTALYEIFIAGIIPADPPAWVLERCGIPSVDPQIIKNLEKERDELFKELMKYKKEEGKEEKTENVVKDE